MFKFLPEMLDNEVHDSDMNKSFSDKSTSSLRYPSTVLVVMLSGILLLSGCQQADTQPEPKESQSTEQTSAEDSQPMPQSDSAAARIKQFQPLYVAQAQGLQRRLQAEYESLQAADASDGDALLLEGATQDTANQDTANQATANQASAPVTDSLKSGAEAIDSNESEQASVPVATDSAVSTDTEMNTSTEVGERDLTVLKRISLEPRKPVMMTEEQMIESYQQAMDALYQPVTTPLSAEDSDTLINIATLTPQLFEHAEIAGRVSAKSPALARLIIQHQVWEQIEAQQVIDMQQMKVDQQQEFETLMTKFNDTIEGYDEQIAKYEQTLKEFQ
ncbi:hypothetical protein [Psychrobacter sp. Pi2-51]|uniref:hypothetical protein n=1 Tax=Psychrobacter sp. Pi2-51 TaxID=2774132 RepID=UPI001919B7ED|nr:hypothetical protein [Psychrobacter sp. Pi2-51]